MGKASAVFQYVLTYVAVGYSGSAEYYYSVPINSSKSDVFPSVTASLWPVSLIPFSLLCLYYTLLIPFCLLSLYYTPLILFCLLCLFVLYAINPILSALYYTPLIPFFLLCLYYTPRPYLT